MKKYQNPHRPPRHATELPYVAHAPTNGGRMIRPMPMKACRDIAAQQQQRVINTALELLQPVILGRCASPDECAQHVADVLHALPTGHSGIYGRVTNTALGVRTLVAFAMVAMSGLLGKRSPRYAAIHTAAMPFIHADDGELVVSAVQWLTQYAKSVYNYADLALSVPGLSEDADVLAGSERVQIPAHLWPVIGTLLMHHETHNNLTI